MSVPSRLSDIILSNSPWDARAWRTGLFWGGVSGMAFAVCAFSQQYRASTGITTAFALMSIVVIFLVLPAVLSGMARRRWLLWAYLPLCLLTVSVKTVDFLGLALHFAHHAAMPHGPPSVRVRLIMITVPLLTSGPVCVMRRLKALNQARLAVLSGYDETSLMHDQSGVWPPPIYPRR